MYAPYIGRFLAVDELWAEQPGWSPYHYAMNNPVMFEDRSGYRTRVLLDSEGASGAGHTAIMIGDDDEGWTYYSYDGGALEAAGKSEYQIEPFDTFEEFLSSDDENFSRYDEFLDYDTGKKAEWDMKTWAEKAFSYGQYRLDVYNCCTTVGSTLRAGGIYKKQDPLVPKWFFDSLNEESGGELYQIIPLEIPE
jgi:hypothetical protein